MERHSGCLEAQATDDEHQAHQQRQRHVVRVRGQCLGNLGVLRRSRDAVEEAQAVQQHRRGDSTQQDILQRGLTGARVILTERYRDVERERQHLDCEVRGQQVARSGHVDRADGGQQDQREELADVVDVLLDVLVRARDDRDRCADEEEAEERGEVVQRDLASEVTILVDQRNRRGTRAHEADHGEQGQRPIANAELCLERVQEEDQHRRQSEDDLRQQ